MTDNADTADIMANTANILARYRREADTRPAEVGQNSPAANREKTATGAAETGEAVIGVAVTGAAAADSSLSAELIRTTGIGTHIGAGAILTGTTAIILRIGTRTTVALYQDSDSLGPDPSWFPGPASPGKLCQRNPSG
jgi:hypothetical protein